MHVSPTREDHGGIQSTLRHHHNRDGALGFQPRFLSLFDRLTTWSGDCVSLAGRGWMRFGAFRDRFRRAAERWPGSLVIHHDGWGLEWLAPLDGADRRLIFLHTEQPHADTLLRGWGPRADGFLSVSHAFAERARRICPDFPEERICVVPFFVQAPPAAVEAVGRPRVPGPWRIGYAGRVERRAKRLDRLPELVEALERERLDFRIEVVGDGSYLGELRDRFPLRSRVDFRGWISGAEYWRTLAAWDVIVLLSDYEGFSRSVMEAMSSGVIPVYPAFSEAAQELLGPAGKYGLYPTGDMSEAAARIARLVRLPAGERTSLQHACAVHLKGHSVEAYDRAYREFIDRVAALPPRASAPATPHWHDSVPLGMMTRLFRNRF